MKPIPFEALDPRLCRDLVRDALAEDMGTGDLTTEATIDVGQLARGTLIAKSPCVIAGLEVAREAFLQLDPEATMTIVRPDASWCVAGDIVAHVTGRARALLIAERTALNFLQRLSGIATASRRYVEAAAGRIVVLDTRKTTPLLRALEKYAVRVGGAANHRRGLDDGVLIKDNHVRLSGGVSAAVRRARSRVGDRPVEVEAQSLDEVDEALSAGADIVLVDNLSLSETREAVGRCRGRAKVEISGGVTLERIPELALTGADYVSVGALTHSAPAADLSFELQPV